MNANELYESWRGLEAQVICRHEFKKTGLTCSAVFTPSQVVTAVRKIYEAGYFLEDISVMQVKEGFLATYHFDSTANPGRVALRALSPEGRFLSITSIYQGAEWHERESADFFGVSFIANTNPVPLLLPDDFQEAPPLLKAEKELAAMVDLKLFGENPEIIDPAWSSLVSPVKEQKEEGAA
ncbi:NADH-quinone oxidoreductase subunit C [Deltaproteobacteria bacterium Smac51]|nr:NADH-quinone oxidoreductase subunit C [Deltaproteobacteria bacterium Smac51]